MFTFMRKYVDLHKMRLKTQKSKVKTHNSVRKAVRKPSVKKATALVGVFALAVFTLGAMPQSAAATGPDEGTITVCKIIIDIDGNVVDGDEQSDVDFTITGFTPDPETSEGAPVGEIPETTFTTPISFNADLLTDVDGDDAECVTYDQLPLGGYYYSQEDISDGSWETPLYNDQYQTTLASLLDFFGYDGNLFDGNAGDDGSRNLDADGHIVLTAERPERILVILNQSALAEPEGDLELEKDVDESTPHQGDSVTYTITVTNLGPADASDVEVSDTLPAGLSFIEASADIGTYDSGTGIWTIGLLTNGQTATLTITVEVTAEPGEEIVNMATVSGDPNINLDNDTDDATLSVASEEEEEQENGDNGGSGGGGSSGGSSSDTGGSGGGSSGGGGGGIADPFLNTPVPQVGGAQTTPPPASGGTAVTPPAPQVAGENLPRTGMDLTAIGLLIALVGYGTLMPRNGKTKKLKN